MPTEDLFGSLIFITGNSDIFDFQTDPFVSDEAGRPGLREQTDAVTARYLSRDDRDATIVPELDAGDRLTDNGYPEADTATNRFAFDRTYHYEFRSDAPPRSRPTGAADPNP